MILAILLCLFCGAFSYAGFYADFCASSSPDRYRQQMGFAFLMGGLCASIGPLGFLMALGCTGFFEHGLKWR